MSQKTVRSRVFGLRIIVISADKTHLPLRRTTPCPSGRVGCTPRAVPYVDPSRVTVVVLTLCLGQRDGFCEPLGRWYASGQCQKDAGLFSITVGSPKDPATCRHDRVPHRSAHVGCLAERRSLVKQHWVQRASCALQVINTVVRELALRLPEGRHRDARR